MEVKPFGIIWRVQTLFLNAWWGLQARSDAVWHMLRGHDVRWGSECRELWSGHLGCITCEACPDSNIDEEGNRVGVVFWMRESVSLRWFGQRLCRLLGHSELRHPQRSLGWDDAKDEWSTEDILDQWYCYRCMADVKLPPGMTIIPVREHIRNESAFDVLRDPPKFTDLK